MTNARQPKTFEDGMFELETLVKTLEEGRLPLEEAISAFERGTYLRKFCEDKLMKAKLKVDQISANPDGTVSTQPFVSGAGSTMDQKTG